MNNKISKGDIKGMTHDIVIESLYPDIQIDIFEDRQKDECVYIASTYFNNMVFYEFYEIEYRRFITNESELIDSLKSNVKNNVLKHLF